jgi:hypothetical protein
MCYLVLALVCTALLFHLFICLLAFQRQLHRYEYAQLVVDLTCHRGEILLLLLLLLLTQKPAPCCCVLLMASIC